MPQQTLQSRTIPIHLVDFFQAAIFLNGVGMFDWVANAVYRGAFLYATCLESHLMSGHQTCTVQPYKMAVQQLITLCPQRSNKRWSYVALTLKTKRKSTIPRDGLPDLLVGSISQR